MISYYQAIESPVGRLHMITNDQHLCVLAFDQNWPRLQQQYPNTIPQRNTIAAMTQQQLHEYFAGERRAFTVPCAATGTDFQRVVWQALHSIAYGETASYAMQAARIGRPTASRAVGHANGQNPISIVVPCHRVIAASGALAGYAGGLAVKEFLLKLESAAT